MQAVVIREVGAFELADVPVPEPGPGEALIRVSVTGLCRTDLKIVRQDGAPAEREVALRPVASRRLTPPPGRL